jgi:hypothetical protein
MNALEFNQQIYESLWSDFKEEFAFPVARPLLAHYTSMQTFERIVSTEQIWFSNPLFMNDLEELKFGMNEGRAALFKSDEIRTACRSDENFEKLLDYFDYLYNDFDAKHALNTYVLCFSEHKADDKDGLLSMWRGYGNGGTGAAIVIDTAKLNPDPDSPLVIGKVDYATQAKRLAWIKEKILALANHIQKSELTTDTLWYAAHVWFHRLKTFAIFSKHTGFSEESEWRVVYFSDLDKNEKFKPFFSHLATDRGMEPKLKLPIKPISPNSPHDVILINLIDRIILGPSISSNLGVNSLKQMLKNIGKEVLAEKVVASEIPFRATNR